MNNLEYYILHEHRAELIRAIAKNVCCPICPARKYCDKFEDIECCEAVLDEWGKQEKTPENQGEKEPLDMKRSR